jgi:hypothetical protein
MISKRAKPQRLHKAKMDIKYALGSDYNHDVLGY